MSNRTAEAQKAIREAWKIEQQLVACGKGTRDWNSEQQKDILENGLAHDENGMAFRGHHMKSADKYPEDQGNPSNIQFLSHEEHKEAHIVCWQPTNWYYNPVSKERIDFGDGPFIPCKVIELSYPISLQNATSGANTKEDSCKKEIKPEAKESSGIAPPIKSETRPSNKNIKNSNGAISTLRKQKQKVVKFFENTITRATNFYCKNETVINLAICFVGTVSAAVAYGLNSSNKSPNNNYSYNQSANSTNEVSIIDNSDCSSVEHDYPDTHASPEEHTVKAHGQLYHTNDGPIWKEKEPYIRGGNKND